MPIILEILAVVIILSSLYWASLSYRNSKKEQAEQKERQKELAAQLSLLQNKLGGLEKRLDNVETIVTDTHFVDPPTTGREAIELQAEMKELKMMIKNLQK